MIAPIAGRRSQRGLPALLLSAALAGACGVEAGAQDRGGAADLHRAGRYVEAIAAYTALVAGDPESAEARAGWGAALAAVGRYRQAAEGLELFLAEHPDAPGIRLGLGTALAELGRYAEAERVLGAEVEHRGRDRHAARAELGRLRLLAGDRAAAVAHFDALIDAYNRGEARRAPELVAVAAACRHLGAEDPQLFKDALRAFDEAIAADPGSIEARVALGELFLEKYNGTEARGEVEAALALNPRHPGALLALARVLHFEGAYAAMEQAKRSLETNPGFVPARIFTAQLLLELEEYEDAEAEARRALETNPRSLEAQAILAAARYLQGDDVGFRELEDVVLAANPRYADFYNLLADACVRNRLYREAADFGLRAVELDPKSWRGWGLAGLNQLRVGEIESGRANLERAFLGDPYNVWFKNTLDLIDTFARYGEHRSRRFTVIAHESEDELLAPYALALAEEAYDALAPRYRIEPPTPIRLELYPSHADFSVRTIGLAGMGALGVCFGSVIAQDSPRARPRGHFNWGSTLWHELAHTFALAVSEHRVPRWLTEGLSVLEERRARPGWGDDLSPYFLAAWRDGELLPVAELNNGFVRPTSPEQIGLSYYQASLVVELIERDWGFETLLAMLRGYRDHRSTEEVLRQQLGIELEEFDRRFETFLEESFGSAKTAFGPAQARPEEGGGEGSIELPDRSDLETAAREQSGSFPAQLSWGLYLVSEDRAAEAVPFLERARDLYPQYVGPDSPYLLLARIHRERGDDEKAARELRSFLAVNETDYESRLLLAEIEEELGDVGAALRALEEAIYVYPLDLELHRRMAKLYAESGDATGLVRARSALVALRPTDMAQALYDLAEAHHAAGEPREALRQVLRALDIAPAFGAAQRLLLRLHDPAGGGGAGEAP
ncbi:MAG TPA: tetratricopeptide repeat protein [Thermoanaerobaculia bacterium]|nr:tetratricopeptide repeat protein [Thermoanaerobaculia bacterium]